MPSEQELGNELVRMRRTFRIAIVAAALGVTLSVIAVIIVIGAVFSVVDRPASEARKSDGAETTSARVVAVPGAPARQRPCEDQTWPYLESQCLTRAKMEPQPLADQANSTERAPNAVVQRPASGSNATTGIAPSPATPVTDRGDAVQKAIIETRPLATPPQAQGGAASKSQNQSQSTGSAAHETETTVREKERKKAVVSRHERQKAKLDEQKAATADELQQAPPETDARKFDQRATKATRRQSTRPPPLMREIVEEREPQSRGGGFLGGFFGGDPD
jgi:hypothetical protein